MILRLGAARFFGDAVVLAADAPVPDRPPGDAEVRADVFDDATGALRAAPAADDFAAACFMGVFAGALRFDVDFFEADVFEADVFEADFFATDDVAAAFFATGLPATGFFAAGFVAAPFFATAFFATGFFAAAVFFTVLLPAAFFAGAFFAAVRVFACGMPCSKVWTWCRDTTLHLQSR